MPQSTLPIGFFVEAMNGKYLQQMIMRYAGFLLIAIMLSLASAFAQPAADTSLSVVGDTLPNMNRVWFKPFFGIGTIIEHEISPLGMSYGGEFIIRNQASLYSIGYRQTQSDGFGHDVWMYELSLMYGRTDVSDERIMSIAAGPAFIVPSAFDCPTAVGAEYDACRNRPGAALGLGMSGTIVWVRNGAGFGLSGFANVNLYYSVVGAGVTMVFGELRE